MYRGYIKLWRKMTDWAWYNDANTLELMIHLLLDANLKERVYRGEIVPVGGIVTGLKCLSKSTGLTIQNIRTSLTKLKSTHELTIKSTNKFSIIVLSNFGQYQENQQAKQHATQQTTNKRLTTPKEVKKEKNIESTTLKHHSSTGKEKPEALNVVRQYFETLNADPMKAEGFYDYYESNGWKVGGRAAMKDWRAAARRWVRQNFERQKNDDEQLAYMRGVK